MCSLILDMGVFLVYLTVTEIFMYKPFYHHFEKKLYSQYIFRRGGNFDLHQKPITEQKSVKECWKDFLLCFAHFIVNFIKTVF